MDDFKKELETLSPPMQVHAQKILDNKDTIKDFVSRGMGIKAILQQLQIPSSSYYNLIKLFPQLDEPHQEGRTQLVFELKNELIKQAKTHTLKTKKTYIKNDIETGRQTQYVEETEKEVDGNVGAIHLLLKNNDIRWCDNPAELRLKVKHFKWQKKKDIEMLGIPNDEDDEDDEDDE